MHLKVRVYIRERSNLSSRLRRTLASNICYLFMSDSDYAADEVLYHVQNTVYLSEWLTSAFTWNTSKPGLLIHKSKALFKCKRAIYRLVLGCAIETSHSNAGLVDSSGAVIGCWGQTKGSPEPSYHTFTTLRREATISCVNSKTSGYYNSLVVCCFSQVRKKYGSLSFYAIFDSRIICILACTWFYFSFICVYSR